MTKAERLTLTTMTANAWLELHELELQNAKCATSWAHYQELNSNKHTSATRAEWCGLNQFCDAVGIDMNDDSKLDPSVVRILAECSKLMSMTFRIYKEFPDYPFYDRNTTPTETDATNHEEEEEEA